MGVGDASQEGTSFLAGGVGLNACIVTTHGTWLVFTQISLHIHTYVYAFVEYDTYDTRLKWEWNGSRSNRMYIYIYICICMCILAPDDHKHICVVRV